MAGISSLLSFTWEIPVQQIWHVPSPTMPTVNINAFQTLCLINTPCCTLPSNMFAPYFRDIFFTYHSNTCNTCIPGISGIKDYWKCHGFVRDFVGFCRSYLHLHLAEVCLKVYNRHPRECFAFKSLVSKNYTVQINTLYMLYVRMFWCLLFQKRLMSKLYCR